MNEYNIIFAIIAIFMLGMFIYRIQPVNLLPQSIRAAYMSGTVEQKQVIRYFFKQRTTFDIFCDIFNKRMISDRSYDVLIQNYLNKIDFKKRALDKFGMDEEEFIEVTPIKFENYIFNGEKILWKGGNDGKGRSSTYQISWLFGTSEKLYFYSYIFYTDKNLKNETAEEFFWKDIVKISDSNSLVEIHRIASWDYRTGKTISEEKRSIDIHQLTIVVPGDQIECVIDENNDTKRAIRGLKTKLEEKKKT